MYAQHPKTGATIRVMKSDASLWKNRKTLVWTDTIEMDVRGRWDTVRVGPGPADFVILKSTDEASMNWLQTQRAKQVRFILLTRKIVDAFGEEKFQSLQLGNVLCLEELHQMYPYLGSEWDGSSEDAILIAAVLFRFSFVLGLDKNLNRLSNLPLSVNITLVPASEAKAPEPLVLIQQYYKPPQAKRARELRKCLKRNIENPFVDKILLFMEDTNLEIPDDPLRKILKVPLQRRITYWDCIQAVKTHIGTGHLVLFANTDIHIGGSWKDAWNTDLHDTCAALLRYEDAPDGSDPQLFGPRADSQDSWLFHSDSLLNRTWKQESLQIEFGKPGCDNAILVEFLRQKFRIVNPCMSLRTIHCHDSAIRNYDPHDIVDRPIYMHVEPTGIHELEPLTTFDGWAGKPIAREGFDRRLRATNPKMIATFCSQMNRDPAFVWSADGLNTYVPPVGQERDISIKEGAFVSPTGLVYKHTQLCVGPTEKQQEAWGNNQMSHLLPCQLASKTLAFPLRAEWLENPALYTLYYLSQILAIHTKQPDASFFCKQSGQLLSAFKLFKWCEPRGHLLHFTDESQVFTTEVLGKTASGVRIMPHDVQVLRESLYGGWEHKPAANRKLVIVADGIHIKNTLLDELEKAGAAAGYEVKTVWIAADAQHWASALVGAERVILSTSAKAIKSPSWAWLWMAPAGCEVLELQEDREPSDLALHLCSAGYQRWTLLQYPRSTPEAFHSFVLQQVGVWFKNNGDTGIVSKPTKPVIYTPPKSMKFGFFGHKGDSFREMIDLWSEADFVERKEDPALTHVWFDSPGNILLYDRPTLDWIAKAPDSEKKWKFALFGNPDPADSVSSRPWTFWPRQPRLVERLVNEGVAGTSFADRKDQLVFYGRVENEKQGAWRQDIEGWKAICTKFSMPVGAKEAYALGPEEYLRALATAKFGLCLRGYGPKCNREIELLAMGSVPIITRGVDITNYAEPLVNGIHVIVVDSPEDAVSRMKALSEEDWQRMSDAGRAWWQRNASVKGSWNLTASLVGV